MTPAADAMLAEAAELRARAAAIEAEARRMLAQEREGAIIAAMALYEGEIWTRAAALAVDLRSYAANGWRREDGLHELPAGAPSKRRAWHRIFRSRDGAPIGDRQIYNIAKLKSGALAISTDGVRLKNIDENDQVEHGGI
ncbi:hypothetical protein [Methylocystis hirsuta]|uniref:Uncharacterized protein n=1 Tax=Methylocystis hirsuta TaxID=369798 RepID=A0A3M9XT54_9HYPH|nr:hypothetical protein [Methylocystis hirsuta]RNJ50288.1 hypothetical protein D1O30_12455 [Methylocystis hirsuta]